MSDEKTGKYRCPICGRYMETFSTESRKMMLLCETEDHTSLVYVEPGVSDEVLAKLSANDPETPS